MQSARRALDEVGLFEPAELTADDATGFAEAGVRVGSVRWAAEQHVGSAVICGEA